MKPYRYRLLTAVEQELITKILLHKLTTRDGALLYRLHVDDSPVILSDAEWSAFRHLHLYKLVKVESAGYRYHREAGEMQIRLTRKGEEIEKDLKCLLDRRCPDYIPQVYLPCEVQA